MATLLRQFWMWLGHISLIQWLLSGGAGGVFAVLAVIDGQPYSVVGLTALAAAVLVLVIWTIVANLLAARASKQAPLPRLDTKLIVDSNSGQIRCWLKNISNSDLILKSVDIYSDQFSQIVRKGVDEVISAGATLSPIILPSLIKDKKGVISISLIICDTASNKEYRYISSYNYEYNKWSRPFRSRFDSLHNWTDDGGLQETERCLRLPTGTVAFAIPRQTNGKPSEMALSVSDKLFSYNASFKEARFERTIDGTTKLILGKLSGDHEVDIIMCLWSEEQIMMSINDEYLDSPIDVMRITK